MLSSIIATMPSISFSDNVWIASKSSSKVRGGVKSLSLAPSIIFWISWRVSSGVCPGNICALASMWISSSVFPFATQLPTNLSIFSCQWFPERASCEAFMRSSFLVGLTAFFGVGIIGFKILSQFSIRSKGIISLLTAW